jgi:hypothetical protein
MAKSWSSSLSNSPSRGMVTKQLSLLFKASDRSIETNKKSVTFFSKSGAQFESIDYCVQAGCYQDCSPDLIQSVGLPEKDANAGHSMREGVSSMADFVFRTQLSSWQAAYSIFPNLIPFFRSCFCFPSAFVFVRECLL